MAAAVARVFEDGGVLLAEAGTGTGKTLAYLVPAILSRERVLISTGTKNLQEQIYFKDIPALRDALGIPFTATYMKGRANYLCLHKLDQLTDGAGPAVARRLPADHPRVVGAHRHRRSRRAAGSAGGPRVLERGLGDRRHLPRHRVPALRRLLRHAHAAARRGVRRGDRQPSPALRRRGGQAERVRRGHPRVHAARSSTKRTSSRTSPRSTSASASAPTGSRSSRATSSGSSPRRHRGPHRARTSSRRRSSGCATTRRRSSPSWRSRTAATGARRARSACARRPSRSARPTTPPVNLTGALDVLESTLALLRPVRQADTTGEDGDAECRRQADRRTKTPRRWRGAPASCATSCGSCCAAPTTAYVYFVEFRGRGIVPARLADRRLRPSSATCCSTACTRRC